MWMQLSIGLDGTDVMAVVQAQPSLLVQESSINDIQVRPEPLPLLNFPHLRALCGLFPSINEG